MANIPSLLCASLPVHSNQTNLSLFLPNFYSMWREGGRDHNTQGPLLAVTHGEWSHQVKLKCISSLIMWFLDKILCPWWRESMVTMQFHLFWLGSGLHFIMFGWMLEVKSIIPGDWLLCIHSSLLEMDGSWSCKLWDSLTLADLCCLSLSNAAVFLELWTFYETQTALVELKVRLNSTFIYILIHLLSR